MTPPFPHLSALRCPDCEGALQEAGSGASCTRCGRTFPAADGILSLMPLRPAGNEEEAAEVAAEQAQRDREAHAYDRMLGLRLLSLLEIPATLGPLRLGSGERVVEVGCGTGRMTRRLADTGAEVVAVDHSLQSLRVLRGKLPPASRNVIQLVRADAARLPVRDGWATRALSCQMIEHLPSAALREGAVAEMARALAPGGRLALSGYQAHPGLERLLPPEGRHSGAIFFHRFTRAELARLLAPHFEVERLTGRLVYILLAHAVKRRSGVQVLGCSGEALPEALNTRTPEHPNT